MEHSEFFLNRHTVRRYTPQHVDETLLRSMIEAASHAPNTGNMQWYSVIATRAAEQKRRLAPAHFNQPSVEGCDVVLTFCLDLRRFEHWCRLNAADPGFNNFQSFVAAIIDTTIFAQQLCTIAELNGLGCCYLGTTTYNAPQIAEVLALPDRVVPVTTLTLGYPDAPAQGGTWRLPVEAILHSETYRDPADADIRRFYAPLEADPMSRVYIDENAKQTLAQVFTDVRYPRDSAEYFSKIYSDFLDRNGFACACVRTIIYTYKHKYTSPCGDLWLVEQGGALVACRWADVDTVPGIVAATPLLLAAAAQLDEYFARTRRSFTLPTAIVGGTPFRRAVWQALAAIPYGATATYGQIAAAIGRPAAVRAVASAIGANPLSIILPCHRIIGADRALHGYHGGLPAKRFLLTLENAL